MDQLANTLLMRIMDHERSLRAEEEAKQGAAAQGMMQWRQQEDEREDREFKRQLDMAKMESQLATRLGQSAPSYEHPEVQRMGQVGSMSADLQQQELQRAAAQLIQRQQHEMQKTRQPERTEAFKQQAGHISYLGHRPSSEGGAGGDPIEDFLTQARKIQSGYSAMRASLPEQLIDPQQQQQDARASMAIERLGEIMLLVKGRAMSLQEAQKHMSQLPGLMGASQYAEQEGKVITEELSTEPLSMQEQYRRRRRQ